MKERVEAGRDLTEEEKAWLRIYVEPPVARERIENWKHTASDEELYIVRKAAAKARMWRCDQAIKSWEFPAQTD